MIRSFTVRARSESAVTNLGEDLDKLLVELQNNRWKIISIHSMQVKEWEYPKYFDSTAFVIIAENNEKDE